MHNWACAFKRVCVERGFVFLVLMAMKTEREWQHVRAKPFGIQQRQLVLPRRMFVVASEELMRF
jgi:hypothetical protein